MNVDSEIVSRFLMGIIAVFAMVAIGGTLANLFRSLRRKFIFTKAAVVMALPPFSFILFLDRGSLSTLYLYAIVIIVTGFAIDGIKHLFPAGMSENHYPAEKAGTPESDAPRVRWEKAE